MIDAAPPRPARPRLIAAVVLASAGAVETAWLAWQGLTHAAVPCTNATRAGCEELAASAAGAVWGLPLAIWGHAAYASVLLLLIAVLVAGPRVRAIAHPAWVAISIAMACVSLILMRRMTSMGTMCPWCVASALLSVGLGGLALFELATRTVRARALLASAGLVLAVNAGLGAPVHATVVDPVRALALARHLRASGAKLHGVWWCVTCREQREWFGAAAAELPYVEGGDSSITEFPTWEIAGRRVTGALPLDSLAARSGFTL